MTVDSDKNWCGEESLYSEIEILNYGRSAMIWQQVPWNLYWDIIKLGKHNWLLKVLKRSLSKVETLVKVN